MRKPKKKSYKVNLKRVWERGLTKLDTDFKKLPSGTLEAYTSKNFGVCLKLCNRSLKEDPTNISALLYKGLIYSEQRKFKKSNECFDIFNNQFPVLYLSYQTQAQNYLYLKDYDNAISAATESLRFNKDNYLCWSIMALAYLIKGRENLAFMLLDYAETLVTKKNKIQFLRGILHEHAGNKEDALLSFIQSQNETKEEEDRSYTAERIYKIITEK